MTKKLNYEEFFKIAITKLRDLSKSHGIHAVFSGFNEAFREYFDQDPIKITQELASQGKIEIRPVKKGVMIYLPGEAPKSSTNLGKTALTKILNKPTNQDEGVIDEVLNKITPGGTKRFPEDFIEKPLHDKDMFEIKLPGTLLQLDSNYQNIVVSPKRHFRYEAKNPPEAKYIIYAYGVGQNAIKVPKDNRIVFKAVTNYEKYCQEIADQSFTLLLKYTSDEDTAEMLVKEVGKRLDLRAKAN